MSTEKHAKTGDITTGVIWKQILLFFFPILIGAFFQQLYNTVDAMVVGQFAGKEALASVGGSSGQILSFIFSFFMGLSTGATVIIAQYFGAHMKDRLDDALHTAYTFALVGGISLGLVGILVARPFLMLLRTPSNLVESSVLYTRVLMSGLVLTLIYNIGSGILRAVGDSKRPLYILIVCCFVNIVLDVLFVMVLDLGVLGAAVATNISQAISAMLVTWLLMKRTEGMSLSLRRLHITGTTLKRILRIGLPTAIAGSMFSVSNMIVQSSINSMGVDVVAGWTACGKIDAIWWMVNQAFSVSITTFVGQNFGAGLPHRIRKATRQVLIMEFVSGILIGLFFVTCSPYLLRLFADSPEVLKQGGDMIRFMAPFYCTFAVTEVLSSTLRAENHVMVSTITNLIAICAFRIVWVTLIVPGGTVRQLISCYPLSWAGTAVLMTIYYLIQQPKILKKIRAVE